MDKHRCSFSHAGGGSEWTVQVGESRGVKGNKGIACRQCSHALFVIHKSRPGDDRDAFSTPGWLVKRVHGERAAASFFLVEFERLSCTRSREGFLGPNVLFLGSVQWKVASCNGKPHVEQWKVAPVQWKAHTRCNGKLIITSSLHRCAASLRRMCYTCVMPVTLS
jgi:hypothetical protein